MLLGRTHHKEALYIDILRFYPSSQEPMSLRRLNHILTSDLRGLVQESDLSLEQSGPVVS